MLSPTCRHRLVDESFSCRLCTPGLLSDSNVGNGGYCVDRAMDEDDTFEGPLTLAHLYDPTFVQGIENGSNDVSDEDIDGLLDRLLEDWETTGRGGSHERLAALCQQSGNADYQAVGTLLATPEQLTHEAIDRCGQIAGTPVVILMHLFTKRNMWNVFENEDRRQRLAHLFHMIQCAHDVVEKEHYMLQLANPDTRSQVTLSPYISFFRMSCMTKVDSLGDYQKLLIFMLMSLAAKKYRRMNEDCYRQIVRNGYGTHAWEHVSSIEEFVYSMLNKDTNVEMWKSATVSGNSINYAVKYLCQCDDPEFSQLRPERNLFAFNNGVFDTHNLRFHPSDGPDALSSRRVAMSYFNQDFDMDAMEVGDWREIDTTMFDEIFTYQGYDGSTLEWVYALLGRLLFHVNERDCWQVAPFFKGVAGCGKSTVSALIKFLFPSRLVSTISSNSEGKFGLAGLCDSYVCICTEVTKKFPLDRGVWQSMVTGERVNVPRKHKAPLDIDWHVPILMSGNENPQWTDKSRSIHRRMVQFGMTKRVLDSNPHLLDQLRNNISPFLVKIVRAYIEKVDEFGHVDIWKPGVMSEQIHQWHAKLLETVDPLSAFMADHKVVKGPNKYCKIDSFAKAYNLWRKEERFLPQSEFSEDEYQSVFSEHDIQVIQCRKSWGVPATDVYAPFVLGCEIKGDSMNPNSGDDVAGVAPPGPDVQSIVSGLDGMGIGADGLDEPI